jgi:hypothetical protein
MAPMEESFESGSPPPRALQGHSSRSRSRSQAAIQSTPPSSVTRRQDQYGLSRRPGSGRGRAGHPRLEAPLRTAYGGPPGPRAELGPAV